MITKTTIDLLCERSEHPAGARRQNPRPRRMEMRRQTRPHRPDRAVWRARRSDEGAQGGVGVTISFSVSVMLAILITMVSLPAKSENFADLCDKKASYFRDYERISEPVFDYELDYKSAIYNCGKVKNYTKNARAIFQHGRSLIVSGAQDVGIEKIRKSIDMGYSAAAYYYADILEFGIYIPINLRKSFEYYKLSSSLGHPDGMAKVAGAELSDNNEDVFRKNMDKYLLAVSEKNGSTLSIYYQGIDQVRDSIIEYIPFLSKKSNKLAIALIKKNREANFLEAWSGMKFLTSPTGSMDLTKKSFYLNKYIYLFKIASDRDHVKATRALYGYYNSSRNLREAKKYYCRLVAVGHSSDFGPVDFAC